jgi:hypothetical protein
LRFIRINPVVAKWLNLIRINPVVAAMSDLPVKKYRPDRPDGMPLRGALDDRLDLSSCDPGPEQPDDRLHHDDGCGDFSNRGGLAKSAKECAIAGANAQNGTNHRRMKSTPTRSRNGDMAADFAFSLVDVPSGMFVPTLFGVPRIPTRRTRDGAESTLLP